MYNVGDFVFLYSQHTGKKVRGVIIATRATHSLVQTNEGSRWIANDTLKHIAESVMANG